MWKITIFFGCPHPLFAKHFPADTVGIGNRTYAYRLEGQMLSHYAAAIAVESE